jgi:hypothetical protein
MRIYLEGGAVILFQGIGNDWQAVERQIERLGFGDFYVVTRTRGRRGNLTKVSPLRPPGR